MSHRIHAAMEPMQTPRRDLSADRCLVEARAP
jgi:hypothetical protein